ncbi:MAG: hypothetical protein KKF89_03880 [Nanoarchaeota archaeon]|nr:hypothetical protein [Nanoarchaeota archaeon]MBU1854836.1 hypothetical protein [Nanoarchaeota archaeon]
MSLGRPIGSEIRQNIVEILHFMKKGYGYEIHKAYLDLFPKASQRVIYYHLKKGVLLKEFSVQEVKKEKGEYSWGETAEKVYYALGSNASPRLMKKVKDYFSNKSK